MVVSDQLQASVHFFFRGGRGFIWFGGCRESGPVWILWKREKSLAGRQYQFHGHPAPNLVAIPIDLANDYVV